MTATSADQFQTLLSHRAAKGPRPAQGLGPNITFKLGTGNPDPGSFPYAEIAQAAADVMETDGAAALSYGDPYGQLALREWVCHKHKVLENLDITPDNILITNGSGDALGLVIQTFVDEGDAVITEAPTFSATLQTLRRNGASLHGIPVDKDGMRTDLLAAKLEELAQAGTPCKLIYTIDTFQNPSGPTLTLARRHELLALARQYNVVVLEDDAYGELRWEGQTVPSLFELDKGGMVARTGTLSKILGAGVRIGWVVASPAMLPYISTFNFSGGVSPLTSRICLKYMQGHFEPHVQELRAIYKAKRDAMIETLETGLAGTDAVWNRPEGGFFIWLKLPTGTDATKLQQLATDAGVAYVAGAAFMPNGGGQEYIRLAFSYETLDALREGTALVCTAIREARS